ncbi:MAG: hypothetical protein GX660_08000 [Clostridiaceae bacterium]|nr:hypothetical protein [Clostridiaceae bacterium]
MDGKKDVLGLTMKDINLLPEEIKSQASSSTKSKVSKAVSESAENVKDFVDNVASKVSPDKGKGMITNLSKNLKDSIIEGIQNNSEKAATFLHSLKKDKIKNLEKLLDVSKKDLMVSSKKNYIYGNRAGKMVIIDRDIWGEPCTVTIKETNKVIVKVIKFFEDEPFVFPVFNEKNVSGDIMHMDKSQIWYRNRDEVTIVLFRNQEPDFIKVNLKDVKYLTGKALMDYIENSKILYFDKRLKDILITGRNVKIENVVIIRPFYTIYKEEGNPYTVLMFDDCKNLCNELTLYKLPNMKVEAWDVLFSVDIVNYIKSKGYSFDNFKQDSNYIEYWEDVGSKKICVMRCKVN